MQAIELIKSEPDDAKVTVPGTYYDHFNANSTAFDAMLVAEEEVTTEKIMVAGNDAKIIRLLKAIKADPRLTDDQEETIDKLVSLWENGEIPAKVGKDVLKKSKTVTDVLELYYEIGAEKRTSKEKVKGDVIVESTIEMLTPKDIQGILGCGINQVYNLFNSRGFPAIRINRRFYIKKSSFEHWLSNYEGKKFTVIGGKSGTKDDGTNYLLTVSRQLLGCIRKKMDDRMKGCLLAVACHSVIGGNVVFHCRLGECHDRLWKKLRGCKKVPSRSAGCAGRCSLQNICRKRAGSAGEPALW